MGDFNAKSTLWGSPVTDARGEALSDWAARLGLVVINTGSALTCVRQRGGSIVDITFASPPAARLITGWRVEEKTETLSDHRFIRMELSASQPSTRECRPIGTPRRPLRWTLSKIDKDDLMAAAIATAWPDDLAGRDGDVDEEAPWLRESMTAVCDADMPRQADTAPSRDILVG